MAKIASLMFSIPFKVSPLNTCTTTSSCFNTSLVPSNNVLFPLSQYPFLYILSSCICQSKKKASPLLKTSNSENIEMLEQEEEEIDEFDIMVGDGAGGGGISLAGTEWDCKVLSIAEDTILSFNGEMKIYAFKTLKNSTIRVCIENLSNRSGSSAYRVKLDEAEQAGFILVLCSSMFWRLYQKVSSPGVERIVQIPQDLDRFMGLPMYVKYVTEGTAEGLTSECDGVLKLVSFDLESDCCTWGIADVRKNREKAGKGRPLSKKQREWHLNTPFDSLRLVRTFSDC